MHTQQIPVPSVSLACAEKLETEKYLIAAPRILAPSQAMTAGLIQAIKLPVIKAECVSSFIYAWRF